MSTVT